MATRNQDWYDLNTSRPYPVADDAGLIDNNGNRLPSHIICGLHVIFPEAAGQYAYIGAITVSEHIVTVIIMAADDTQGGSTTVLATVSLVKPLTKYRQYPLDTIYPGAGGWIVFGEGIEENYQGRFSTASQTLLAERVARKYTEFPISDVGKLNNSTPLTGLVLLEAGKDIEIVSECREVPAYPLADHNPQYCGSVELGSQVRDVIVFRLVSTAADEENVFDTYKGPCDGRPESLACGDPQPIQFIGAVSPDCCGNIYLELQGCAVVSRVTHEDTDVACGVVVDCDLSLPEACVTAKYLPDENGVLPTEYDDLCESESEAIETPADEVVWVSDAFIYDGVAANLAGRETDGYGYPWGEAGAGEFWAASVPSSYQQDPADYVDHDTTAGGDPALLDFELPTVEPVISTVFQTQSAINAIFAGVCIATDVDNLLMALVSTDGADSLELWERVGPLGWAQIGGSTALGEELDNNKTYRLTAFFDAINVRIRIYEVVSGQTDRFIVGKDAAHGLDVSAHNIPGIRANREVIFHSMFVGPHAAALDSQTIPADVTLPQTDDFTSVGPWVMRQGDFDWDTGSGLFTTQSIAMANLATYEPALDLDGTIGREAVVTFQMLEGEAGHRHHAGVVINYRETEPASDIYQYWLVDVDWDGEFTGYKSFRVARYTGYSWVTEQAVAVPGLALDNRYRITVQVEQSDDGSVWLTGQLEGIDGPALDIAIGPVQVSDYLPDDNLFGLIANRASTEFQSFSVDNL